MTASLILSLIIMAMVLLGSMAVMLKPLYRPSDAPKKTQDEKGQGLTEDQDLAGGQGLAGGMIVLALALSLGLYAVYGSFGLPDQPLASRQTELAEAARNAAEAEQQDQSALDAAKAQAKANPDNIEAQFNLADAAAVAGDSTTEINTLKSILRQTNNPLLKAMIGEALTREAGGIVTTRALAWIEDGLNDAPDDWRGRYLKGLYLSQSGDDMGALGIWSPLAEDLNGSEIFPAVAAVINEATARLGLNPDDFLPAPLPDAVDIAGMVEGLEAELTTVEENRDRWVMLVRSLTNLGEDSRRDDAIRRYLAAMPSAAEDLPVLLSFVELLLPLDGLPEKMPDVLAPLLASAQTINPENHGVLFFSGLAARSNGDRDGVKVYWGTLLSKLDPENPLYALLDQEMKKTP